MLTRMIKTEPPGKKTAEAAHRNQVAVLQMAFAMACLSVDVCEATLEETKEQFVK